MHLEPVDVSDPELFAAWFSVPHAVHEAEWPGQPGWTASELRSLGTSTDSLCFHGLARADDGAPAGALWVVLPQRDNLTTANLRLLEVHPDHRRKGIGTGLLAHAERLAREHGRTVMIGGSEERVPTPAISAAAEFARRHGYVAALGEARRSLRLPPPDGLLDRLFAEAEPHAVRYTIVTWTQACPEEFVEGRAALARSISTDAPSGDLTVEEENWDPERIRRAEDRIDQMERDFFGAGAVTARGELVAVSDASVPRGDRRTAYQFDTVVLPAHRGHRLGTLVKVANLRQILAASPATEQIYTWNAVDNEPMLKVNDEFGFEVVAEGSAWQKVL